MPYVIILNGVVLLLHLASNPILWMNDMATLTESFFFLQENTIIDMLSCKCTVSVSVLYTARAQIWQAWNGLLLPWESGFLRHRNCKGGEAERQMMLKTDQRKDWDKSPFFLSNTTSIHPSKLIRSGDKLFTFSVQEGWPCLSLFF